MSKDKGLIAVEIVDDIFILGREEIRQRLNAVVPLSAVQDLYIGSDGPDPVYAC